MRQLLLLLAYLVVYASGATIYVTKQIPLYKYTVKNNPTCPSDYYFDSSAHYCFACPTHESPDKSVVDGNGNPFNCLCDMGYATSYDDCTDDTSGECVSKVCTSCITGGNTTYLDRSACVKCGSSTSGLSTTTNDCACPTNQVLVETDYFGSKLPEKRCESCPTGQGVITVDTSIAGMEYTANPYLCQSCPDPLMTMSVSGTTYTCTCPSGYTLIGVSSIGNQSCALTTLISDYQRQEASAIQITYHGGSGAGTIQSLTMEHYFTISASRCNSYGGPDDIPYCQQLANLCVLQLYDANTDACAAHLDIITRRGTNLQSQSIANWVEGMPWLYYSGGVAACTDDIFDARVTLQSYHMEYVVAKYTMNGTFLGYEELETLLSFCGEAAPKSGDGGGTSTPTKWQIFGTTHNLTFTCDLTTLMEQEQVFYELFIYNTRAYPNVFAPVPVRIVNVLSNGETPNEKYPEYLCGSSDVLVRRFFLFDRISGLTSVSTSSTTLKVLRYASFISIDTSITKTTNKILPPILTVQYTEVSSSGYTSDAGVPVQFHANYTMDTTTFFRLMRAFFIAYMIVTALIFALRYYNWTIRNARVVTTAALSTDFGGINLTNIYEFSLLAMSTWTIMFFGFTTLICWYFFVFFKIQTVASIMLPPQFFVYQSTSPYYLFVVNLHVMTFFQLAYVLVMIQRQCNADLFFIDWEPAKTRSTDAKSKAGAVSVWRTIMVANEWSEMQTLRKTNIVFTLFALGLFLYGLNLQYNATQQPILDDKSAGQLNMILRFANTTFFWVVFSLGQYLWKFLIYERYISEPPERLFVDFCTLAKVSVIVLDEKYHGYYLHCRSPHQYADGTMVELVEMLHKEEAGLTVDRSLEGAPADVQCFQIFLTGEWRGSYDKICASLIRPVTMTEILTQGRTKGINRGQQGGTRGLGSLTQSVNNTPPERVLKAWRELTIFLQEFVENNFGKAGLRRNVREPTYYEKLVNAGPDLSIIDQPSVFFTDRDYYYCKVLFLGREADLLLLNILSYSLFDLWFNSTAISMALTYLLDLFLCTLRQWWGQAMISKKTLIDGRFLI